MKIKNIYRKFSIPSNLQEHMLHVAKIVLYLRAKWEGPQVDWNNLLKAAMLHDLGNIVRFQFDSASVAVYGREGERLEYWKNKQSEMAKKYGNDDHEATRLMLREINADTKIIDCILSKSFANAQEITKGSKWEDKILLYADMRVLPFGIGTLEERFNELEKRRKDLMNDPSFKNKINACRVLEFQIQEQINIPVSSITKDMVDQDHTNLFNLEI